MADTPAAASNPLAAATDRIRESARWLLTAFAAVGVILAGGLQLSSIGELTVHTPDRLVAAGIGLVVTLGAVIYAIGQAGGIATKSYMSLSHLNSAETAEVRAEVEKDPSLLKPHATVADLERFFSVKLTETRDKS